jgi:hypothetical protein
VQPPFPKEFEDMTSSPNITPPIDGVEELDAFLADHPIQASALVPIQTDLEDFTGPTPQPVKPDAAKGGLPPAMKAKSKGVSKAKRKPTDGKPKTAPEASAKTDPRTEDAQKHGSDPVEHNGVDSVAKPTSPTSTTSESTSTATRVRSGNVPRALGYTMTPAPDVPLHALGSYLASRAEAIARVTQAPVSIILSTLLSVLALIAQAHVNVRLLHGAAKPVSLFLLTIGASGLRKTTVDDAASQGAKWAEAALLEAQKADDTEPTWQRIIRTGSFEGLLRRLQNGAGTAALFNDDAGSFLGGTAMSQENRMKTNAGLSSLWDGSAVNHALADAERSIHMAHRRLCVHFGIQPELILPLLADATFLNQGILARFLVTVPDSNIGYRPIRRPDPADLASMQEFAFLVRDLLQEPLPYRSEKSRALKPRVLELSDGAFDVFADYANEVEVAQRPFGLYATLTGPASKFAEIAIRIAGVLAYFENQSVTVIAEAQARRAVELMRFYAAEMVRLVGVQQQSPMLAAAGKVLRWLHRGWNDPTIRFQDFYQKGPVRPIEQCRVIVPVLEQHGWLERKLGDGYAGAADVWAVVRPPSADTMVGGPCNNRPTETLAAVTC